MTFTHTFDLFGATDLEIAVAVLGIPENGLGRNHPSRDAIFFGQKCLENTQAITSHDVLSLFKTSTSGISRDVVRPSQNCGFKLQRVFALGDGCTQRRS